MPSGCSRNNVVPMVGKECEEEAKESSDTSVVARRKRTHKWWLRLERPDRETFRLCLNASEVLKQQVTVEDLDLLPWDGTNGHLVADLDGTPYVFKTPSSSSSSSSSS
eukprot:CAMPEP_0171710090 /NCGR_PEP_ID=MMETSP0991-20121206/15822_1 /TAXON_ID=483369 /ORGANISM="non described non described, Strain CCMP2098" /LENGTH=107 /DNA_ID=CAMNT_0012300233 /DNA_START=106 /DNA_END=426 /DNA_ORIENTATION=+